MSNIDHVNGFVVVRVPSRWLTLAVAKELSYEMMPMDANTDVVFDLTDVECADLTAVRCLAVPARRVKVRGGTVQVVVQDPQIKQLFFACSVQMVDAFRPTIRDACYATDTDRPSGLHFREMEDHDTAVIG